MCRKVNFTIQWLDFINDFISLELGGADIILGVQWLRTLDKCIVDSKLHELIFHHDGKLVTLRGILNCILAI